MILFNIQNVNDEIVCLQNKRINNNSTQTKHANKLEPKLTELARTQSEHNYTDKRYKTENNYTHSSVQFSFLLFLLRHMNKITKC